MDYANLWDARIAIDLVLGGIGAGMFLCAVFGILTREERPPKTLRASMVGSVALVALGALVLVSELGRPFMVTSTLTGFNATSVTSWGGILQGAFILVGIIICVLVWKRDSKETDGAALKLLGLVGTILAALVLVYHGLVLNSLGRGLWADAMIIPLFAASSVVAGGSLLLLVDWLCDKALESRFALPIAGSALGLAVLFAAYGFTVAPSGSDALYCYEAMLASSGAIWWGLGFGVGALVPFALSAYVFLANRKWTMPTIVILSICAIAGSAAMKIVLASTAKIVIG